MKRTIFAVCLMTLAAGAALYAQDAATAPINRRGLNQGSGQVIVPTSSIERPEDLGVRVHTHSLMFIPDKPSEEAIKAAEAKGIKNSQPAAGYTGETPASLACLYGVTAWTAGCNPGTLPNSAHAVGGSKAIAIVDSYDYPTALNDLTQYSMAFGLPVPTASTFTVVYQGTTKPPVDPNCGPGLGWNCWEAEEAIDIEMAHAMAPSAHIYLVEANSNGLNDQFAAVLKAGALVKAAGGGEVSMSFGGAEFCTTPNTSTCETYFDSAFNVANVVFFASTGDHHGVNYPSTSPNVVAVGGTTLSRDPYSYDIESESAWEDSGGGYSLVEPEPAYQDVVFGASATYHRAVPDVAAEGNPRTSVWVYDSFDTPTGKNAYLTVDDWMFFGGTSVASPLWAGIVNHAGHFSASSTAELALLYSDYFIDPITGAGLNQNLRDVTTGSCGYYQGWFAVAGWDPCTGLGAPYGTAGK